MTKTKTVINRLARRMDVTPRKTAKVVALHEHAHMSVWEIASKLRLTQLTVGRIIMKKEVTGNPGVERRGRCGRKRKTNAHDDNILLCNSVKDPQRTSQDLQCDLLAVSIHTDSSTVRWRLLEVHRTVKKTPQEGSFSHWVEGETFGLGQEIKRMDQRILEKGDIL